MSWPGRSCPLAYRYQPEDLAGPAAFETATLYVAGGLYGNTGALDAILQRAAAEPGPYQLVFNGDFHYLDAHPGAFRQIAEGVLAHRATLGNVEYALTVDDSQLGCGCDYPAYIPDRVVADSNAVVERLRATAASFPGHLAALANLPRYLTASVGPHRVAIVHGDPESLAGWRLALEAIEPADHLARARVGWTGNPTSTADMADWCTRACVEVICSTHTGLPYAQDVQRHGARHLIANNGCAGLPNFTARRHGVITRLSTSPAVPTDSLYGTNLGGLRFDALPVHYDTGRWLTEFLDAWPPETPGHRGYHSRITDGTWLRLDQAARGQVHLIGR